MPYPFTSPILRWLRDITLIVLAVTMVACDGANPTAPPPKVALTIVNGDPNLPLKEFRMWRCGTTDHGGNRLKDQVAPRTSRILDGIEQDCYEFEALWREWFLIIPIEYTYEGTVTLSGNLTTEVRSNR